jgi:nitrogen-specific signal transduction histidine kinase
MNGAGELVLSTRVSYEYQIQRRQKGPLARMLLVEIRDQGKGIPKEVRDGLFTPFFITKKKGSDLGLLVSQQKVEKHNFNLR